MEAYSRTPHAKKKSHGTGPNSWIANCIRSLVLIFNYLYLSFIYICIQFRVTSFKSSDNSTSKKTKICCYDRSQFRDFVNRESDAILLRIAILVLLRTLNTKKLANL